MKDGVLQTKSFAFAVRIVNLCRFLCTDKKEYVLSKQLLRSGTAIGVLVREAGSIINDNKELLRILISIINSTKQRMAQ